MKKYFPKIEVIDGIQHIYDPIRKKYLVLTPEEKVRQGFIYYLITKLGYSKNLIRTEMGVRYNDLQKRSDILVFDRENHPYLLIECKAENVPLTKEVIEQASRYNLVYKAPFICITNGLKTYCFSVDFDKNITMQLNSVPLPKV